MLIVRPRRRLGILVGAAVSLVLLVVAAGIGARVAAEPPSFTSFTAGGAAVVLAILACCFAYWTYGCWTLHYGLDRNALTIGWAGNRYRIPLAEITGLVLPPSFRGPQRTPTPPEREALPEAIEGGMGPLPHGLGGLWWPGHRVGQASGVLVFATEAPVTLVNTSAQTYAISPPNPAFFAEELKLRARLGPTEELSQEAARWWPWELPFWQDRTAIGLFILALALNVGLFAHQALAMPSLPDLVPVHFTSLGLADRAGAKQELFEIPVGGFALLLAGGVLSALLHRAEPFAAYVTLAGGLVVQVLLWGAWLRVLV